MKELLPDIDRWRARGEKVALATVVATRRTSPRPVGSKLAVSESGELAGSVSGGCVESDVVLVAQDVLGGGTARLVTYGITDEIALEGALPRGEAGRFDDDRGRRSRLLCDGGAHSERRRAARRLARGGDRAGATGSRHRDRRPHT